MFYSNPTLRHVIHIVQAPNAPTSAVSLVLGQQSGASQIRKNTGIRWTARSHQSPTHVALLPLKFPTALRLPDRSSFFSSSLSSQAIVPFFLRSIRFPFLPLPSPRRLSKKKMSEGSEASPSPTTPIKGAAAAAAEYGGGIDSSHPLLHTRREPFEYGLLPISKLIFTDPISAISPLRDDLLRRSPRAPADAISESLQISHDHACLVLETLASVLASDADPLAAAKDGDIASVGADVHDLVLFLYIQSYKRLLPRSHKDSPAIADVWPSTSAFDGYLSVLSPLQLVRSNSRRFMPSQADEEAHQLSYLQKHLANMLALLAEPAEGEDEESLVGEVNFIGALDQMIAVKIFIVKIYLAFVIVVSIDPDMPAVPVPATQVHDWLLQHITAALEHTAEKASAKDASLPSSADPDVTMTDACTSPSGVQGSSSQSGTSILKNSAYSRSQTFVEGVSKASLIIVYPVCEASASVINCHDSVIYILAPLRHATLYGCSDATIVLGAIGKSVRVEHCERVQVITASKRVCIANCRECVFFLGVNQRPLILGDNHKLQVAPYNTFYSQLEEHMAQAGVDALVNRWNEPLVLGMVDPHDSLSHPAGVSDAQAESATCLDPDHFTNFLVFTRFILLI
ncbi:hypothetical protein ACLOJK_020361 [Asimina triloba]